MGKRDVRIIVVPKRVSIALLIVLSASMATLVWFLSGRAYATESHAILWILARKPMTRSAQLAVLMPLLADLLLFLPWGFLMFVVLDTPSRPRRQTYALTILSSIIFAAAIQLWQIFLPSRVTTVADSFAHGAGALVGAALGHLRKEVRVRFET